MFWFWPSPPAALAQAGRPFSAAPLRFMTQARCLSLQLLTLTSLAQSRCPFSAAPRSLAQFRSSSFQLPQIHATVQVPSPSYILPPYHPTLTQSLSFPLLTSHSHPPRHTFFHEITCVVKGETLFSGTFMQRHTFFKGIPCIADENHLCSRRQRHLNTPSRAATHHFPRNNLCRERGNVVFVKPPSR